MQERMIEFVRGLRAAGVRVSMAENLDAFSAVALMGVTDREMFQQSLRATLIKNTPDLEIFDELFPLYFSADDAPLLNALEDLTADEQSLLQQALESMDERLDQLLEWLTTGDGPTSEELEQLMQQSGIRWANSPSAAVWVTRRMLQQMGMGQLEEKLRELAQRLQELGMTPDSVQRVMGVIDVNRERLSEYVAERVKLEIARQRANRPSDIQGPDLMHKPFGALSESDVAKLRIEIRRLVNQLRTRAALRRKKNIKGKFDARSTLRRSQKTAGVPFELRHKKRKLKPNIVFIFDVSNSMQTTIEFMLYFVSELQDQISKMRSFAFYDNLAEVSDLVNKTDLRDADALFYKIQQAIPGYLFRTNLGYSLDTFFDNYLNSVNGRATVIIMGDGRNNYQDPRTDLVKELQKRARRLVWFTPEDQRLWGTGDSHMHLYAPLCDDVYPVRNLAQLSAAVDQMLINE